MSNTLFTTAFLLSASVSAVVVVMRGGLHAYSNVELWFKLHVILVACIFIAVFLSLAVKSLLRSKVPGTALATDTNGSKIYSLRHGVLNINTSNVEMWMNMGYWKNQPTPTDFPLACKSLLQEILKVARLIPSDDHGTPTMPPSERARYPGFSVIDVGFGCGDQAIALSKSSNLLSYVGITLDREQYQFASHRLRGLGFLSKDDDASLNSGHRVSLRQVFNSDAAKPSLWSSDLKDTIGEVCSQVVADADQNVWVLGLDVLYHFSPSRLPLFEYSYRELQASIMAFDLLLPDPDQRRLTILESCLLRLVSLVTSTPYTNFLTPSQYRSQLVAAGYSAEDIEIHDISPHVFRPLVDYMSWQDRQLKAFGLGIGAFNAARWIFGWWARSGIIRGCIVVVRHNEQNVS